MDAAFFCFAHDGAGNVCPAAAWFHLVSVTSRCRQTAVKFASQANREPLVVSLLSEAVLLPDMCGVAYCMGQVGSHDSHCCTYAVRSA